VRAGQLRKRLRIETLDANELDSAGHPIEKWKLFGKVWGRVEELSASESERTDQSQPSRSLTVKIRYNQGVKPDMRLALEDNRESRVFGIEGITKDEKNREMVLTCREK
jgi:SPP1 family predicted phage head-tail adaptor